MVCIKRPRCDIQGGSETEVTVTSKQHTQRYRGIERFNGCITKTEKAESEAQRGKPKGTLESESRNAIE